MHGRSIAGDLCITACPKCGKGVLDFGLKIHNHEYHSGSISTEVDDNIASRMKVEAEIKLKMYVDDGCFM